MTSLNRKQISIAVLAVVLTTAMIGTVIASSDSAFAYRHHHHHHHHHHGSDNSRSNHQEINQSNEAHQRSTIVTAGDHSPVFGSGNNVLGQSNRNSGGNAAAF